MFSWGQLLVPRFPEGRSEIGRKGFFPGIQERKESWTKGWDLDWQSGKAASMTEDGEGGKAFVPDAHLLSPTHSAQPSASKEDGQGR